LAAAAATALGELLKRVSKKRINEAPNPKLQAPEKLQISSSNPRPERCGGHPGQRVEVWGLELLWSLELGI